MSAEAVTAASQCRAERRERSCRNVDVKKITKYRACANNTSATSPPLPKCLF